MSQLLALSISDAVLGAIWAYLALGPLAPYVFVWGGFITAACSFAAGGDNNALVKTLAGIIYGAIVGWITLLVIDKVPMPSLGTIWPALVVGFFVFFLVIVASIEQLSFVPANIYGFAMVVAYTLCGAGHERQRDHGSEGGELQAQVAQGGEAVKGGSEHGLGLSFR